MTLEQFCRKHRYHLWYERTVKESYHITHNYANGVLSNGIRRRVGEWVIRMETITLARTLRLKVLDGTGADYPVPCGTGRVKKEARDRLLSVIRGHRLYVMLTDGAESVDVPKDLK